MADVDDELAKKRGTTRASRGLGKSRAGTTTRRPRTFHRTDFYDHDAQFLGSWQRRQRAWSIFLIRRDKYEKIVKNLPNLPTGVALSDFAVSMPGDKPGDPQTGLAWQLRMNQADVMVEQLAAAGKRLVVDPVTKQRRFLDDLLAEAKREKKEHAAYIVLDYPKARLKFVKAKVKHATASDLTLTYGIIRGTNARTLPPPDGDASQQVLGDVHTHYLRDPETLTTTTGTHLRTEMHYGVSDVDVASAKEQSVYVYAVDHSYIHRANPNGTKTDRLKKTTNVLVDALELFSGKRAP